MTDTQHEAAIEAAAKARREAEGIIAPSWADLNDHVRATLLRLEHVSRAAYDAARSGEHEIEAQTVNAAQCTYKGVCSCGWEGEEQENAFLAGEDAEAHRAARSGEAEPSEMDEAALQRAASNATIAEEGRCAVCGHLTRQKTADEYLCPTHMLEFRKYVEEKAAAQHPEPRQDQPVDRRAAPRGSMLGLATASDVAIGTEHSVKHPKICAKRRVYILELSSEELAFITKSGEEDSADLPEPTRIWCRLAYLIAWVKCLEYHRTSSVSRLQIERAARAIQDYAENTQLERGLLTPRSIKLAENGFLAAGFSVRGGGGSDD